MSADLDLHDGAGFSRAYRQHARAVHGAAMSVLHDHARAQDVVQDVFVRLWRRPDAFDPRRGALGPYLRMMARSRALDLWREAEAADRASERLRLLTERDATDPDAEPVRVLERVSRREELRAALHHLPPAQREAVMLAFWGELTAPEIARLSDVALGTAKSRVRLGVRRLRELGAAEAAA